MVYKVVKGDTLLKIAATHKTTPADIMKLNPIIKDPSHIEIGWELKMPDTKPVKYVSYTVVAGDTLAKIAKLYKTTVAAIVAANPAIKDPNLIRTGMVLKVPDNR